jgi:hypothetical protein
MYVLGHRIGNGGAFWHCRRRCRYRGGLHCLFLYDVLRDSGLGAVLLCARQARISELKTDERTNLCHLIQANQSALNYPAVCALATRFFDSTHHKQIYRHHYRQRLVQKIISNQLSVPERPSNRPYGRNSSQRDTTRARGSIRNLLERSELYQSTPEIHHDSLSAITRPMFQFLTGSN